ncbi:MAG: CinA family nicotinamide mononucleotide deamidase-related protein [Anaerolineales bacterium]|nr:CinA family nicotinamide mononucleotide deamidase-related protein [Anaerolineales bacterium]
MEAEIITIGTELLLGEIVDTNSSAIARALREIGLDIYRTTTVGDNAERIAQAVKESMGRAQAVITTGGLGPTIDDATREGIAMAFDVELEFRPELWEQIQERFARFGREPTENNRRQAYLPQGAKAIVNPIGSAPGFLCETEDSVVIALQGVPAEMSHLLENDVIPYLRQRLNLRNLLETRILRTAGIGESALDARIQDLEKMSNPTVGLSAHPGRVDIRITAKASTIHEAEEMIWKLEATIRQRLGEHIYGADDETLEAVALEKVASSGWRLVVAEFGTEGALAANLAPFAETFAGGQILPEVKKIEDLSKVLGGFQADHDAQVGLGLVLGQQENLYLITIVLRTPEGEEVLDRTYGGPPAYATQWAVSLALDRLRRRLS